MGRLVEPGQLATYLREVIDSGAEEMAIRVAEGWLASVTTSSAWPDPAPEDLWAWALELASIAYSNPKGLTTRTIGDATVGWAIARRQEILDAAQIAYGAAGHPVYCFPPAPCWPDDWEWRGRRDR